MRVNEYDLQTTYPTRKNPCLTHRQNTWNRQRYEHISSSAGSKAAGYSARLTRSWVTLVLTTPYEGRGHQLSCCYRETDVAYRHDEIRQPTCVRQKTCRAHYGKRPRAMRVGKLTAIGTSMLRSTFRCSWWRHQVETFSSLLALCTGNSPVTGEFPTQRPVTRSFDVFFDLRLNKRLSKQSWGWWFETPSRPLWRHCNVVPVRVVWCACVTYCGQTTASMILGNTGLGNGLLSDGTKPLPEQM